MSTIPPPKKLDFSDNLLLSAFSQSKECIARETDEVLKERLAARSERYLNNGLKYPYQCFPFEVEELNGFISEYTPSMLMVPAYAEKLFEGRYIKGVHASVAHYIFTYLIGYDTYFDCPCIILRDKRGDAVDIPKYRPHREGYDFLPKYLYVKSEEKPENRGEFFLYPFQIEMERLFKKERFLFVGEGIKNSVNALVRSVPFLSIESTSNAKNPKIIAYINDVMAKGINVYAAMDGDSAGEKGLKVLNEQLNKPLVNLIDFNSGIDFTEYIKKEFV